MKKESILGEEAYIYNHREDEKEVDKWKKMNLKQKFDYFNDYYRNKVIITIIVLGVFASLMYSIFSPKPDVVISIAVVNDYWNEERINKLSLELSDCLGLYEGKQEVQIDDTYFLKETGMGNAVANTQRLVARFAAGDINILIADKAKFDEFAANKTFMKVTEALTEDVSYKNRLTSNGYGISLKDSKLLKELESIQDELVLGILSNVPDEDYEYISKTIKYILQKS